MIRLYYLVIYATKSLLDIILKTKKKKICWTWALQNQVSIFIFKLMKSFYQRL